jgi:hypothetical protein
LDEHGARSAGGVEDAAVEGFDDFDDQLDDATTERAWARCPMGSVPG